MVEGLSGIGVLYTYRLLKNAIVLFLWAYLFDESPSEKTDVTENRLIDKSFFYYYFHEDVIICLDVASRDEDRPTARSACSESPLFTSVSTIPCLLSCIYL